MLTIYINAAAILMYKIIQFNATTLYILEPSAGIHSLASQCLL